MASSRNYVWLNPEKLIFRIPKGKFVLVQTLWGNVKPFNFGVKKKIVEKDSIAYKEVKVSLRDKTIEELNDLLEKIKKKILSGDSISEDKQYILKELEYRRKKSALETEDLKKARVYKDAKTYYIHDSASVSDLKLGELKAAYEKELIDTSIDEDHKDIIKACIAIIDAEIAYRQELENLDVAYPEKNVKYDEPYTTKIKEEVKVLEAKYGIRFIFPWNKTMVIDFNRLKLDTEQMSFDADGPLGFTEKFVIDFDYLIELDDYDKFTKLINSNEGELNGKESIINYLKETMGSELDSLFRNYMTHGGVNDVFSDYSTTGDFDVVYEKNRVAADKICNNYGFKLVKIVNQKSQRPTLSEGDTGKLIQIMQIAKNKGQDISFKDAALLMHGNYNVAELNGAQISNILARNIQGEGQPNPAPTPNPTPNPVSAPNPAPTPNPTPQIRDLIPAEIKLAKELSKFFLNREPNLSEEQLIMKVANKLLEVIKDMSQEDIEVKITDLVTYIKQNYIPVIRDLTNVELKRVGDLTKNFIDNDYNIDLDMLIINVAEKMMDTIHDIPREYVENKIRSTVSLLRKYYIPANHVQNNNVQPIQQSNPTSTQNPAQAPQTEEAKLIEKIKEIQASLEYFKQDKNDINEIAKRLCFELRIPQEEALNKVLSIFIEDARNFVMQTDPSVCDENGITKYICNKYKVDEAVVEPAVKNAFKEENEIFNEINKAIVELNNDLVYINKENDPDCLLRGLLNRFATVDEKVLKVAIDNYINSITGPVR